MGKDIPTRPQRFGIYEGISLPEVGKRKTLNEGLARADEYIDYLLAENARLTKDAENVDESLEIAHSMGFHDRDDEIIKLRKACDDNFTDSNIIESKFHAFEEENARLTAIVEDADTLATFVSETVFMINQSCLLPGCAEKILAAAKRIKARLHPPDGAGQEKGGG